MSKIKLAAMLLIYASFLYGVVYRKYDLHKDIPFPDLADAETEFEGNTDIEADKIIAETRVVIKKLLHFVNNNCKRSEVLKFINQFEK